MSDTYVSEWHYKEIEPDILTLIASIDNEVGYKFMLKTIGHLDHTIFRDKDCQTIFKLFSKFYERYKTIPDKSTVEVMLSKLDLSLKKDAVLDRIYTPTSLDEQKIKFIQDEIPNFIKRDKLYRAIMESAGIIDKGDPTGFDAIKKLIDDASRYTIDDQLGLHYIDDAVYVLDDLSQTKSTIKSFSDGINHFLQYGGFTKEEIYFYMGASGAGKSIFLVQEGISACRQGKNVLHVSFELSDTKTLERYYKSMLQLEHKELIAKGGEKVKKNLEGHRLLGYGGIRVLALPAYSINSLGLSRIIERLHIEHKFKVDMLIIDYSDLMNPILKTGRKYDDQGRTVAENRSIVQEFKNTGLGATQATRSAINSADIGQEHTADSIDKVRALDFLGGIINTRKHKQFGHIDVIILKNRNGAEGAIVRLMIDYLRMTIKDRPEFLDHLNSGNTWDTFDDSKTTELDPALEEVRASTKKDMSSDELKDAQSNYTAVRDPKGAKMLSEKLADSKLTDDELSSLLGEDNEVSKIFKDGKFK